MTNKDYQLDSFHKDYGKVSDYPEEKTLEYAQVEILHTIADILQDIANRLEK